jgi:hypothetical protein
MTGVGVQNPESESRIQNPEGNAEYGIQNVEGRFTTKHFF